jgi:hypothetical protein
MNLCFRFLFPLLCVFVFNACSNEIDVLADYEENASVYALLDPSLDWQFVKINKVFTNPNNKASDIAKVADSLFFDTLSPFLIEIETAKQIPLYRANIALKDSGLFANSPNYIYVTNEKISTNYSYRIDIKLPNSGKLVTSTTNIVNTPYLAYPVSFSQRSMNILLTGTIPIQFQSPAKGKIYDAYFHFNYREINKADTNIKTNKTISWKVLRSYRTLSDRGNEFVTNRIPSILFYDLLKSQILENPDVNREILPCAFEFISGNLELDNYIQASTPSIGIVQKQSDYSNVSKGVGIFASRNTVYLDQVILNSQTKSIIINNSDYKYLGFVK